MKYQKTHKLHTFPFTNSRHPSIRLFGYFSAATLQYKNFTYQHILSSFAKGIEFLKQDSLRRTLQLTKRRWLNTLKIKNHGFVLITINSFLLFSNKFAINTWRYPMRCSFGDPAEENRPWPERSGRPGRPTAARPSRPFRSPLELCKPSSFSIQQNPRKWI